MKSAYYNPAAKSSSFLSLGEIAEPKLKINNAIVKVVGVGVCGSDLLKLNRALVKPGTILGHELVGTIDQISDKMSERYGFKVGDRILSSHHVPCMQCDYCLNGKESLCQEFKSSNFNPGAFCEYLELSEGHLRHTVMKIPDDMSNEVASFTEPVACCIKAICKSGLLEYRGQPKVLIIGLGSIGLIIGQLIKHYNPKLEVTASDLNSDRLTLARELGLNHTSTSDKQFDFIFLCAGANATIDLAIKQARNGATIVVFSSVPDQDQSFSNNDIYYKELTILGSYSPNLVNLQEALQLLSQAQVKVDKLITHRASLENLGETIKLCEKEQGIKTYLELN